MEPYVLTQLKLGASVTGIDLSKHVDQAVVERIKTDVRNQRILVFRNQESVTPERHLEIGRWFGDIESTFYDHPKSPLRDIFRVSNDRREGCTNVGRTGWHIDGTFQPAPFSFSIYHSISEPTKGATSFVGLTELLDSVPSEKLALWERLWMVSDRRSGPRHPIVYKHPSTGHKVMCFHLGMTEGFMLDKDKEEEGGSRMLSPEETKKVMKDIHEEIIKDDRRLIYEHRYEPGDFIISDNLAVGHEASPETQLPRSEIGLRVMHRVTLQGTAPPAK